ncbi:MAG: response regulator [Eubacteriales bacterium]|nr:response regulator [Eubacteriales bacterium]MDD3198153.1 response regulator [Eubacteriales bacterium]MDD3502843.1 response regulator [Eubacteriales bacterium]MDD4683557.1 response regulator [Eubacteriales bacterium]
MKTVLVVDDAAFMRVTIKNMLEKNGYSVIGEAENGKVAVVKYNELKPDIVTMDITMPEMDGLAALKAIMQINSDAKIVMMTAMGQQGMVKEAVMSGAKGFIVKPFKEETVIAALAKL